LAAHHKSISPGGEVLFDTAPVVEVKGFAFYDSAHYAKKDPQKGNKHGTIYVDTLWELHPAWSFAAP
jgi:hypothetical protein